MAETSWPFDDQDTTEAQFSTLQSIAVDTGVLSSPTSTELAPYGDGSGMFVKIPAGFGVVRGFVYRNDALLTLTVPAAGAASRVDSVVLRLDPAANTVTANVKAGAPGSTSGPALVQVEGGVWETRLADVSVPTNTSTVVSAQVTDRRQFTSEPWGRWTNLNRPASPRFGKAGVNSTTQAPEWWDGSAWRSFSIPTTDASVLTSGTLGNARLSYSVLQGFRGDRTVDAPVFNDVIDGDWNLIYQPGVYRVDGNRGKSHSPQNSYPYGTLLVLGAGGSNQSRTQMYFAQYPNSGAMVWTRTAWNGNDWGTWYTFQVTAVASNP